MLNFISKPGNTLTLVLSVVTLASITLVAAFTLPLERSAPTTQEVSTRDLRGYLNRVGLFPGALTAVGATSSEATAVVGAARAYLDQHLADLRSADQTRAERGAEVETLARIASQGRASAQQLEDLATTRTALATAESALQTALDAFFTAAAVNETDSLEHSERSAIQQMVANRGKTVPFRYCFSSRSEADWVALRDGLIQERVHIEQQEEPPAELANLLSGFRSDSATVQSNLDSPTAANIASSWETATSGG